MQEIIRAKRLTSKGKTEGDNMDIDEQQEVTEEEIEELTQKLDDIEEQKDKLTEQTASKLKADENLIS